MELHAKYHYTLPGEAEGWVSRDDYDEAVKQLEKVKKELLRRILANPGTTLYAIIVFLSWPVIDLCSIQHSLQFYRDSYTISNTPICNMITPIR